MPIADTEQEPPIFHKILQDNKRILIGLVLLLRTEPTAVAMSILVDEVLVLFVLAVLGQ